MEIFFFSAIQSALNRNDLAPDVEEKLQQLQKYNEQSKDGSSNSANMSSNNKTSGKRARDEVSFSFKLSFIGSDCVICTHN